MLQPDLFYSIFGDAKGNPIVKARQLAEEYPYFSMAQLYLLSQLNKDDSDYEEVAGRTGLHVTNPYYLQHLLQHQPGPISIDTATNTGKESKESTGAEMLFEPLFATDYFASQGIKLSEEVKPDDKLGKQLKSFTDWLKTMKKVHEQKLAAGNDQLDATVQHIAEISNQEAEVITESMAEVYLSQGKPGKARGIYDKLSLLNPEKRAYFAAKSDKIKEK